MQGGLEIVNPLGSSFLEKVARDERIARDHPRRDRDGKPPRSREVPDADGTDEAGEPMSSTHIDLRI